MSFHFVVEQVEVGEKTKGKEEYLSQSACVSWSESLDQRRHASCILGRIPSP